MTNAIAEMDVLATPRQESRRRIAIVLSMGLVLLAAAAALFLVRGVESQLGDIAKTYEVRRQARELILSLVDAETGQRGYLLTQDRQYLEPYAAAVASMDSFYQGLLTLLPEGSAARARIVALEAPITAKRQEMASTISLAGTGRLAEALAIIRSDEGRRMMENIRRVARDFIAEEDGRLVERNLGVERYRQMLVAAILLALAGSAMLAYVLFNRTQRQVSALSRTSAELLMQNEELEAHVRARTADAEEARAHAERERARVEALLQDTNHRIGNSLATVSSLLGLQVQRTKSGEVREALEAAQRRVHAIASGHRRLRLGADLETASADEFLDAVVDDMRTNQSRADITFVTEFEPLVINARDSTTIGIVISELITNALKHAFPDGRTGTIWARLKADEAGVVRLTVEDDGRGLPSPTAGSDGGLGSLIIKQLARQFGGEPRYEARPGGGTSVSVSLPGLVPDDS